MSAYMCQTTSVLTGVWTNQLLGVIMSDQKVAFDASLVNPGTNELAKDTNWWGAFVIGLSGTILVIALVGWAVQALGGYSIPLFVVITAMGVLLCYCLAELVVCRVMHLKLSSPGVRQRPNILAVSLRGVIGSGGSPSRRSM